MSEKSPEQTNKQTHGQTDKNEKTIVAYNKQTNRKKDRQTDKPTKQKDYKSLAGDYNKYYSFLNNIIQCVLKFIFEESILRLLVIT